jgi:hypothetical protein
MPPESGTADSTLAPMWVVPPARRASAAKDSATATKSTTPVSGECRAATPRAWGSTAAISSVPRRRRFGTRLARPRRSSSSSRDSSLSSTASTSFPDFS